MNDFIIQPIGGHTATGGSHRSPAPIFTIGLIRELRGSPLTVLVAILLLEQAGQVPITEKALKEALGYNSRTIAGAISELESPFRQIIQKAPKGRGWRLSRGFQLPLVYEEQACTKCTSLPSSCSSSLIESMTIYSDDEQEESQKVVHFVQENHPDTEFLANHAAALQAGIREPKASALAKLPHVTPDFIRAHIEAAKSQGNSGYNPIGTAISRIENNWPVPEISRHESHEWICSKCNTSPCTCEET